MRTIKFRAWQDNSMLTQKTPGVYGTKNFLDQLYEDCELMEFSGLKDKNGKTYCQDDIVKDEGKNYRLIKGTYMFELQRFYCSAQDNPSDFFGEGAYTEAEIIGNIHENPDLIK